jgi:hypothetical protein
MSNGRLTEYFAKNRYIGKWSIGDRVYGKLGKIPFVGTVGNDTLISEDEGPRVSIHIDLPIMIDGIRRSVIFVTPCSIKKLKVYD